MQKDRFLVCGIIVINRSLYADDINLRPVTYTFGTTDYEFEFYTDSIKFHTKANGYEKFKGMETNCNMNSIVDTNKSKMQGYGNYEFKPETNLFSFIDYCYSKDPIKTNDSANKEGNSDFDTCDYSKLMSYRNKVINISYFENFWKNMSIDTNFNNYQDNFFFSKYTYPATDKIGINIHTLRNVYNKDESIKEYLTCLTSYIFSITPQAQVEGLTFGKGDLVPFLYYKENTDMNVRNHIDGLKDIAKYAYVALIEGWCTLPTPYHLWENEYNLLFGPYEPEKLDYDLETLKEWYDKTYNKYKDDKGKKGNNLLGSDINHIIESDYSIETQLEATEYYLKQVFDELGINNDFKETMARNELMAKYMMQNSSFQDTIKDYEVTIKFMEENLQRGTQEPKNTHTVVTSDFQVLEFDYKMDKMKSIDSDDDGLNDGKELGDEKWIDITEFAKKTYEDAKLKGETHKATFEEQVEDIIKKNGAYTDFSGNKVYGSVKWDDMKHKVLYRVYDYKSNPKLNDTDFDGLWDNSDSKPIDNKLSGTSTEIGKVEYNQDFRWFYTDNKKYNDELCTMSLIASNLARGNTITTDQVSGNIQEYLEKLGFADIRNISNNGEVYVGKKKITYYGITKNIYALIIGERNLENNYRAMFMKAQENNGTTNAVYIDYGKTLEEKATEIGRLAFLDNNFGTDTYWVTGYGLGGSIASELASKLTDAGGEVFCYTFGAINTGTNRKGTYANIKNVINEDDYIPKMMNKNIYSKPGQIYSNSIKENLMFEYRDITGNTDYRGDYCLSNFLTHIFEVKKNGITIAKYRQLVEEMARNLTYFTSLSREVQIDGEISDLAIAYDNMTKANKNAHSIKSYYVLAKSLNGFDLLDGDEDKKERYGLMSVSFPNSEYELNDNDLGRRDGYMFIDEDGIPLKYKKYEDINFDNLKGEQVYKVNDYVYSNYTINGYEYYDLDYSRFWHMTDEKVNELSELKSRKKELNDKNIAPHTELYDIKAGDYTENSTRTAYGFGLNIITNQGVGFLGTKDNQEELINRDKIFEFARDVVNPQWNLEIYNNILNNDHLLDISGGDRLITLDGRIVAAFPIALLNEENKNNDETAKVMHYKKQYSESGNYVGGMGVSYDAGGDKMYKYVDCVFEDKDTKHQFVVPFIAVDVKNLHHMEDDLNYKARFTDNRYGQIREKTIKHSEKAETKIDGTKYSHRDDERYLDYINPIEPYIYSMSGSLSKGGQITNMLNTIFITKQGSGVRLISMRIYDKWFADYTYDKTKKTINYNENAVDWWRKIRKNIEKSQIDPRDKKKTFLDNVEPNIVVKYHTEDCDCINNN